MVLGLVRVSYIFIALSMIGVLIYFYGFPQTTESEKFLTRLIELSFLFYTFRFIVRLIYELNPIKYIMEHWAETLIILYLVAEGIAFNFYDTFIIGEIFAKISGNEAGKEVFMDFSNIFIQLFFVIYIIIDIFKKRDFRQYFKIHPGLLFMLSILLIITIGTGLLLLPEMTNSNDISFIDVLFLATSSTSVTGLTTLDISEVLTFKGQLVVLFLIQIGGLNTIAFGALYLLIAKLGVGLKQHAVIEDFVNESSFLDTEKMFVRIVKWTLAIELIGAIGIFIFIHNNGLFDGTRQEVFYAVFHAISSFCSAGLSTVSGGMMNPLLVNNYFLHFVVLGLFFLGGFGMIYLFDLFGIKHLRNRMKYPWKTLKFDTKTTLYTTLILLVAGAVVFFIFEYNRSLVAHESGFGKLIVTLFSSMTPRSTGFSTVDFSTLSLPVMVFMLFLMFVGASSGSSGGGIRVSTFAVLLSSVSATIQRKQHVELFKRTIDTDTVLKAYTVLIFYIAGNLIGIFILLITEHNAIELGHFTLMDIIFEHVSAASTVGLSTGITPHLTVSGKIVIIVAMFIGRCGTLTIAYLFGKQMLSNYKYPKGHLMIG